MSESPHSTVANSNLEPAPAELKISRNCYGQWYLFGKSGDWLYERCNGPTYIRADIHEAKLDQAVRREVRLQREIVRLTKQIEEGT